MHIYGKKIEFFIWSLMALGYINVFHIKKQKRYVQKLKNKEICYY